ncbi:MAG: hypothetical protein GYA80_10455, partial [Chloroflexi bacterium]|nr:hypothetical protein [Chloroflexota bacterium]
MLSRCIYWQLLFHCNLSPRKPPLFTPPSFCSSWASSSSISSQLARRMGVPFRSGGGLCGSKIPDAQAAYESSNTLWSTILSGVNFCLHAAGWLEGGLASSYEKLIMDADQLTMLQKFAEGLDFSENGQAL